MGWGEKKKKVCTIATIDPYHTSKYELKKKKKRNFDNGWDLCSMVFCSRRPRVNPHCYVCMYKKELQKIPVSPSSLGWAVVRRLFCSRVIINVLTSMISYIRQQHIPPICTTFFVTGRYSNLFIFISYTDGCLGHQKNIYTASMILSYIRQQHICTTFFVTGRFSSLIKI